MRVVSDWLRVVWVTKDSQKPQVKWGTASKDYTRTLQVIFSTLIHE